MLFTTTPGQHLGVVMNLNLILKIADMERDRPYKKKVGFEIFCMQVCAHRVRCMQVSKRVPLRAGRLVGAD